MDRNGWTLLVSLSYWKTKSWQKKPDRIKHFSRIQDFISLPMEDPMENKSYTAQNHHWSPPVGSDAFPFMPPFLFALCTGKLEIYEHISPSLVLKLFILALYTHFRIEYLNEIQANPVIWSIFIQLSPVSRLSPPLLSDAHIRSASNITQLSVSRIIMMHADTQPR